MNSVPVFCAATAAWAMISAGWHCEIAPRDVQEGRDGWVLVDFGSPWRVFWVRGSSLPRLCCSAG